MGGWASITGGWACTMGGWAGAAYGDWAGAAYGYWPWAWADPSTPKNATMVKPATNFPWSLFIK
jgi:hypothetical protein